MKKSILSFEKAFYLRGKEDIQRHVSVVNFTRDLLFGVNPRE